MASRSASVKAGWIVARAVDGAAVVIGYLPAGLRPGRLGQLRVPAIERKPNLRAVARALIGISGVVLAAPCLRVAASARDRRDGAAAQ
jgi:hypothetical protein